MKILAIPTSLANGKMCILQLETQSSNMPSLDGGLEGTGEW